MTVAQFWKIIDDARAEAGGWEDMQEPLKRRLKILEMEDLMLWGRIFDEYHSLSYKEKLWAAAYVINGGCSDDGFDYFRGWLIANGSDIFHKALADPDALADMDQCEEDVGYEGILGAAASAYFAKTGAENRPYDQYDEERAKYPLPETLQKEIRDAVIYADDIDIVWDEDELEELLPRLCEAFDW